MYLCRYLIFHCLIYPLCVWAHIPTFHSESSHILSDDVQTWTHKKSMENGMEIYWNANDVDWLTMEVTAFTHGYIGIGFSPNGGMTESDLIIGWVDDYDGTPHLQDYYGIENGVPIVDPSQDYELILAMQTDNYTTIRFRRKWDTCDEEHDMQLLGDDTVRFIWAWHQSDPQESLHWHGPNRGTRSVFLKTLPTAIQFPDDVPVPGVQEWTLQFENLHVPAKETVYYCKIFKFPNYPKKQHIIGYRPIIQKENMANIHHATLYKCGVPPSVGDTKEIFEKYINHTGGDCLTEEVPLEWIQFCFEFMIVIPFGAEGEMFPDNVGLPFIPNEKGEPNYIRFEIHYNNPSLRKIVDSSGLKIFHTEKLREEDIGMIFLGAKVSPFHVIPPNIKKFTTSTFCAGSCTKTTFPKSGVKVTGLLLHAHEAATAVRLRHIRDGKELTPIAVDNHFDVYYQQIRTLLKEVRILPGDHLIVECDYNSSSHGDIIIVGGYPSQREMCQVALWVYPKVDMLTECRSQVEFHSFFNALDIESVEDPLLTELKLPYIPENFTEEDWLLSPPDDSITILHKFPQYQKIQSNPWRHIRGTPYKSKRDKIPLSQSDGNKVSIYNAILKKSSNTKAAELLQNKWGNGSHYVYCAGLGAQRIQNKEIIQPFPLFEPYISNADKSKSICKRLPPGSSKSSSNTLGHLKDLLTIITAVTILKVIR